MRISMIEIMRPKLARHSNEQTSLVHIFKLPVADSSLYYIMTTSTKWYTGWVKFGNQEADVVMSYEHD